jgi:hypothetical protein
MKPIGILEVLNLRGFPANARAKFVRHQDKRYPVEELIRDGYFEAYQASQRRPVFDGLDYIISFSGHAGTKARFYGVYEVIGRKAMAPSLLPAGCLNPTWADPCPYFYVLRRDARFDEFSGRLIVEWGRAGRTWHQYATTDKEVVEMRPAGRVLEPFDDYLDFTITFEQLQQIAKNPDAHSEWRSRLSAVAGVYLILDSQTGAQYVGSAYGTEGIWGRWTYYAKTGHGDNQALIKLLDGDPSVAKRFRFSLLQILPRSYSPQRVIALEGRYKEKLGSRVTGLNAPENRKSER